MFAILFEVLFLQIREEILHFAGWEGGLRGTKIVNKHFVNKLAFSIYSRRIILGNFVCFVSKQEKFSENSYRFLAKILCV